MEHVLICLQEWLSFSCFYLICLFFLTEMDVEEFAAHSGSVNCLRIGKKACRQFITGGDDKKVNLWSIGNPTPLMSLCGHTSPVESLAFDSAEVLVAAGASAGVIKLWDLEETKEVRTLTGHKSYCSAVEFHPFGHFFASGSMDPNLRIWDIRKKECIHTYKGHSGGISTIRFTPDGRWVVSGGLDNIVKIWDLTAGKLLHDFKFHEGHIRSMDFHPLEFLLATGSADKTVKFWDLETFELIGSARPEGAGVQSVAFHPDGRTLFCGLDDSLKVYSWEPLFCHDTLDIGWSTLGDLCIHDGTLTGCSYYQNSIGVWVADISLIDPYGASLVPEQNIQSEQKYENLESPFDKQGSHRRSTSSLRCTSPDYETKEIKNIYIDTAGGNPVTSRKVGSFNSPKVARTSVPKEINKSMTQNQIPAVGLNAKTIGKPKNKSFTVPKVMPWDNLDGKETTKSRRQSITSARTATAMSVKPAHKRRPSVTKLDVDRLSMTAESLSFHDMKSPLDSTVDMNFHRGLSFHDMKSPLDTTVDMNFHKRLVPDDNAKEFSEEKPCNTTSVVETFEKVFTPRMPSSHENCAESVNSNKGTKSVKYVNGVAIVHGRTRSLVDRFEKREIPNSDEVPSTDTAPHTIPETAKASPMVNNQQQISGRESTSTNDDKVTEDLMQNHDSLLNTLQSRLTKLQVVRHFWERNDIKGAINALRKFPDHSVQADMVSVLVEKMEIFTLDLFSYLLPLLLGLLDSTNERHASVSLEMLVKLVALFGPVIHSSVSAPPAVGVDLHAEQRRECCNQCFIQLQKIQKTLPALVRRGGMLAKCAIELSLVLQQR
ncbi:hypothetical protein LguiB_005020 [Lonicera macranthoides]